MKKRIVGIDLMKSIAIMGVILLHVTSKSFIVDGQNWIINRENYFLQVLYYLGTYSIPIFFW